MYIDAFQSKLHLELCPSFLWYQLVCYELVLRQQNCRSKMVCVKFIVLPFCIAEHTTITSADVHNNELLLHSADCTVQVTGHASRIVQDIVFDFYLVLAVCMDGHNV